MDRLIEVIAATHNPSIVGLDPTEALVPKQIITSMCSASNGDLGKGAQQVPAQEQASDESACDVYPANEETVGEDHTSRVMSAFYLFNRAIIDAVAGIVPAVKPQIAMYEAYGAAGIDVYHRTCAYAHERGLYVLGDIKRGDIGSTASAYARHLTGVAARPDATQPGNCDGRPWMEDAVTVNPYLGSDGVTPFTDAAAATDKDVFALVRTSNPSSREIQELELTGGEHLYEHVADLVEHWGADSIGEYGYSRLGAVVGATHPEQGRALRERMPHTFFLVPGYGAQGGTAADVAGMFDAHGSGAIVNSSRGIIGAWRTAGAYSDDMSVQEALDLVSSSAATAAVTMRDDLNQAIKDR